MFNIKLSNFGDHFFVTRLYKSNRVGSDFIFFIIDDKINI